MIASDFIYRALRKCGQIKPGYLSSSELLNDGLLEWKTMYDSFNVERTLNYTMPDYVFPITGPGTGTTGNGNSFGGSGYTIGPSGADFTAPRPTDIVRMNLYMTSVSPTQPTRIPLSKISMEQWMNISVIQLQAINVTTVFAYDPQWPNGVIWVWPPLNGNSLEIFTWGQLTPPATLATTYSAPPGYEDLIIWRLAQRLWPMCTRQVAVNRVPFQYICGQAAIAAQKVRALNAPMPKLKSDFTGSSRPNVGVSDWTLLLTGIPY